ncbi:hypothetical protein [Brevibacillus agri]|uniref:hypothetical protein n=1 Tax=Brevibacillus agri TaxID=51101 RepID=UPI00047020EE|nr:hypothetical protein [Brevibacillus agri]
MIDGRVRVSQHAAEEYVKDFGGTVEQARSRIGVNIRKATYITEVTGADGKSGTLYAYNGACYIVRYDDDVPIIVTVYKTEPAVTAIRNKVYELVTKELRKIERKERDTERRVAIKKAELAVEVAQINLRKVRSRSASVRAACQARINALNAAIAELDAELRGVVGDKRAIAKTVAAYI